MTPLVPPFILALIGLFIAVQGMIEQQWKFRVPLLVGAAGFFGAAVAVACFS